MSLNSLLTNSGTLNTSTIQLSNQIEFRNGTTNGIKIDPPLMY
jgi:hypothetical protein